MSPYIHNINAILPFLCYWQVNTEFYRSVFCGIVSIYPNPEIVLFDDDITEFRRQTLWHCLVNPAYHRAPLIDEDPFIQCGYKPQNFDIIVTKSKTQYRAVYKKPGAEIISVDAPGQCPADISVFEYRNAPQDVYPIKDR